MKSVSRGRISPHSMSFSPSAAFGWVVSRLVRPVSTPLIDTYTSGVLVIAESWLSSWVSGERGGRWLRLSLFLGQVKCIF